MDPEKGAGIAATGLATSNVDARLIEGSGSAFPRHRGSLYRFMYDSGAKNTHDGYSLGLEELGTTPFRQALASEFVGMFVYQFMYIGLSSVTSSNAFFTSVMQGVLYALLIFSIGGTSGAHLNPLITMVMMGVGKTSVVRGLLYVGFQTLGAVLAGQMYVESTYTSQAPAIGLCGWGDTASGHFDEGYLLAYSMTVYFMLGYGILRIAMDPRHSSLFGPLSTTFLVGMLMALVSMVCFGFSADAIYITPNPAMCVASYAAQNVSSNEYNSDPGTGISWVAAAFVAVIITVMHWLVKPHYSAEEDEELARNANRLRRQ